MILPPATRRILRSGRAARRAEARHTDNCTTADAVDCAAAPCGTAAALSMPAPRTAGRDLSRPARRPPEPKRLAFVKNRPNGAPWLFRCRGAKGRRTGLRVEPDILITAGGPTARRVRRGI